MNSLDAKTRMVIKAGFLSVLKQLRAAGAAVAVLALAGGFPSSLPAAVSYLDNGVVKVGIDLTKGGSITYLSVSGTTSNIINSADLGREVQQSYYSGPNPYNPSNNINPSWNPWPWNPIQTGDSYNHPSQVLTNSNDGTTLYVKCIPMQWALNNVPGECTFESWITLAGNAVLVSNRLLNARSDLTPYGAYDQELPAVYAVGTLYRLFSYSGNAPFTGDAVTNLPNVPPPWTQWRGTENWAAQVNASNWGLGIYTPGVVQYTGGFSGTPGSGGPTSGNTGYMAPVQREILDGNITYTYNYHLILGTLTQIRTWVYAQPYRPGCNSVFQSDRQHWTYAGITDSGWPLTNNRVRVSLASSDPQMLSPLSDFYATNVPKLYIRAAYQIAHPAGRATGVLYWETNSAGGLTGARSVSFPIITDGQFHTYELNLAANSLYQGLITQLRFDPALSGEAGDYVDVAAISSLPFAGLPAGQNLITNGDFTANAAAFTNWPGYTGPTSPGNPTSIAGWTNLTSGGVGVNGAAVHFASSPFGPTNSGLRTYAFIQGGVNGLRQNLTLTPYTTYQLDFDVAARTGSAAGYQVQLGDSTQTYYSVSNAPGNNAQFSHVTATFTTPSALSGPPAIQLINLTAGDNTIDFANISLVMVGSKGPTTTALASSLNPSTYGSAVTLTATVRTTGGIPTGMVTFLDGDVTLGAGALGGGSGVTATAALTLTNLTAATHSLTASYGGDATNAGSLSSVRSQGVNPKPLTVAGLTAGNKMYDGGTNAALSGTAALVGVVGGDTVTLTGTPVAGFADQNVGNAKPVGVSGYTLGGASATNYSLTQPVLSANLTARPVTLSGSRVYDGTTAAAAAILALGNNLDGANLTLSGSGTLASRNVGLQPVSAGTLALGGTAAGNYTLTGLTGAVTITASASITTLAGSPNPSPTGTNVLFTATVSAVPPGGGTPTNAVQFRTNGVAAALVSLNGSAQAAYATSGLPHGSNVVMAEYVSDGNFLASTGSVVQVVNTPPVANALTLGAVSGLPATLRIIGGTNATDADGDPLTVAAVSAPAHGLAGTDGTNVTYTATNSFAGADSFNYTVRDPCGGAATNTVTVNVIANSAALNRMIIGLSGGNVVLTYLGIPWNRYALEQAFSLSPPAWMPVMTNPAAANGYLLFTNPPPPGSNRFWRTRSVP